MQGHHFKVYSRHTADFAVAGDLLERGDYSSLSDDATFFNDRIFRESNVILNEHPVAYAFQQHLALSSHDDVGPYCQARALWW